MPRSERHRRRRPSHRTRHSRRKPTRPTRSRSGSFRWSPLLLCGCSFGTPFIQAALLLLVPFLIALLCFLAGFWQLPVWRYVAGTYTGAVYHIGAQGYSTDGITGSRSGGFLYDAPWPAPMKSLPLLLLFHLILAILILTSLLLTILSCLYTARNRHTYELRWDAWARTIRKPRWYERCITIILTLASGSLLCIDNAVWGVAREQNGQNLSPEILGYFVNIAGLLLWSLWVILQCAATHDRKAYYTSGGKRVYEA
ncbi:hypothetical protein IAU60_005790 [Kwoniella sp. DSM 27419]